MHPNDVVVMWVGQIVTPPVTADERAAAVFEHEMNRELQIHFSKEY